MNQDILDLNQGFYINKHQDVFWTMLHGLGGIMLQSQLARWLKNDNKADVNCSRLVSKLVEAKLIKVQKLGNVNILLLRRRVLEYFDVQNRRVKLTGTRLKKSALIMEKYLSLGCNKCPTLDLRRRLEKTSALTFLPVCYQNLKLINKYIKIFEEKGLSTIGLKYEQKTLEKRFDFQYKRITYPNFKLDVNPAEMDLYKLEAMNCYISGICFKPLQNGRELLQVHADFYLATDKPAKILAEQIITAKQTLEGVFDNLNNNVLIYINLYSHNKENLQFVEKVYSEICSHREYVTQEEIIHNTIKFIFFDTKMKLFSCVDPTNII